MERFTGQSSAERSAAKRKSAAVDEPQRPRVKKEKKSTKAKKSRKSKIKKSAEESDDVEQYFCDVCRKVMAQDAQRWTCGSDACADGFDICAPCFVRAAPPPPPPPPSKDTAQGQAHAAEWRRHEHALLEVPLPAEHALSPPLREHVSLAADGSGRKALLLTPFAAALRTTQAIALLDKHNVKAVLTLMDLHGSDLRSTTTPVTAQRTARSMAHIYVRSGRTTFSVNAVHGARRYHLINIPDVSTPSLLEPDANAHDVLCEAIVYIERMLAAHESSCVLVHCEKGERRSPMALLAYLCAQGATLAAALHRVAEQMGPQWLKKFKETRAEWLRLLRASYEGGRCKARCEQWATRNAATVRAFTALPAEVHYAVQSAPSTPTSSDSESSSDTDDDDDDDDDEETRSSSE